MKKITAVVEGGKSRQESAFKGLKEAEKSGTESGDIILFQNGCNPLVSKEEILKIIKETKKNKAAVLAQTPQAMEFSLAKRAFEKAFTDNFRFVRTCLLP